MAPAEYSPDFFWDIVFFKVEERVFCVPRCEFEQSSEVFADMFCLPSGNPEGLDKEHPVVLEGYKADEFTCLLRVMYPRAKSLISGTSIDLRLQKEEWVSVVKLSTIWNMSKVREYAIHRLSTDATLTPIEKVQLARAHKVAKWLEEGLTSLVDGDHKLTREEMATLGWETSALVLWIRNQSLSDTFHFKKDSIKCANCSSSLSLFVGIYYCYSCDESLAADDELSFSGTNSASGSDRVVSVRGIRCSRCPGNPFHAINNIRCNSCSYYTNSDSNVRVTPKKSSNDMIKEVFGTEMEDCRLAASTM